MQNFASKVLGLPLVRMARVNRLSGLSALRLGFAFLGIPVCLTAVWNPAGGFRSAVGRRLYPDSRQVVVSSHCSHISFALPDPIQGQSATSLRTDDLFYPATARGGLVFTQPCLLQEHVGARLDHLAPCAALFAAWVLL